MSKYLSDTNICIYFLKGLYNLDKKIRNVGLENCYISEITLAELKFGAENSQKVSQNRKVVVDFADGIKVVPIFNCLDTYAREKARLRKEGKPIDDFDLLIGATAISNKLTLITRNRRDFDRLKGIKIQDWTAAK